MKTSTHNPKPLVLIKAAISLDGKIATKTGESQWISNAKSRAYVHILRSQYDAILVGAETVIKDNPKLTIRIEGREETCHTRIVLDSKGRIPLSSTLLNDSYKHKTLLVVTDAIPQERESLFRNLGVQVLKVHAIEGRVDFRDLMDKLGDMGIKSVFIEGGGEIIASALKAKIVDKVAVAIAPILIGGQEAKGFMAGPGIERLTDAVHLINPKYQWLDDDIILEYDVEQSVSKEK